MKQTFEFHEIIPSLVETAVRAGEAIMDIYNGSDFEVNLKSDNSPLTNADHAANHIIVDALAKYGWPILSEEGRNIPFDERKDWSRFWMVDPLDGTKEFIKKNGEFTVNIALIENQVPIWGVVYAPALNKLYFVDDKQQVILRQNGAESVLVKKRSATDFSKKNIRVVASRSHLDEKTTQLISTMTDPVLVSMGSSLKFMIIAEGNADVYPRYAPTMEWDTAAAHAILNRLDINVLIEDSTAELSYNKENLLNPGFIVY